MKQILASDELSQVKRQKTLFQVISKIRESLDLDTIFQTTATEVRQLLTADRVGIFRFYPDSGWDDGEFVSENVLPGFHSALAARIHDHCFGEQYAVHYQKGKIQAVADIYHAGLNDCHVDVLRRFQIRANLVAPLLQGENLWGLLCVHQCTASREWRSDEIEFVRQIATELGVAIRQAELLAKTQQQAAELTQTLTDLQKSQAQLIQGEKMSSLGQLVAGIAHEINNPVNFIYGNLTHASQYAQDLLEWLRFYQQEYPHPHPGLPDRIQAIDPDFLMQDFPKILSSMQIGADRIRQIVLSLRNFSRLDEAEMKPVNIHDGIDSTLLILQHRFKPNPYSPGIEIIKEYSVLPLVECYASQLNQVFMNIINNAVDALEESRQEGDRRKASPPQITIRTGLMPDPQGDSSRAIIRIADNGHGVPLSIQSKLFDPFFTTKPAGKGTGLGLSISYEIVVDRHGGTLECYSQPSEGTEFWIEIPIRGKESGSHEETECQEQISPTVNPQSSTPNPRSLYH
ncbi:MAG: GAF domain-containing sensor histidine kinase [Cyanobacteria bacterium CRU_2_1]|nr:GAF domain-containing sensor histidine kinase [Cyanobacteria bacterium RU_5_0]NJR60339.1 GAF domain-containing sensor histidine kinase [Cyanobacteria bacterium CRU_2_1]